MDDSISSENKGFKLLSKLGWKEGQKLGKNENGIDVPVPLVTNTGTVGLGFEGGVVDATKHVHSSVNSLKQQQKNFIWKKTQDRMKQILKNDVFSLDADEDDGDPSNE